MAIVDQMLNRMCSLSPARQQTRRILVVDDEEEVREILAETLVDFGYLVLTAAGAEEALSVLARDGSVAMVITDVRMPGMSGLELAEEIYARWPEVKVVLISGYFLPQSVPQRFLKKPFHMKELASVVRSELG
jgi:DNA-binding NtrC family response regulator